MNRRGVILLLSLGLALQVRAAEPALDAEGEAAVQAGRHGRIGTARSANGVNQSFDT